MNWTFGQLLFYELGHSLAAMGALFVGVVVALIVTLIVELAVAALLGFRSRHELDAVFYVNLVTNPILAWVLTAAALVPRGEAAFMSSVLAVAEIVVVLVEWRLLVWALASPPRKTLVVSLMMNAASLGAGLLLGRLALGPV